MEPATLPECRPIPDFDGYRVSDTGIAQTCWGRTTGSSKQSGGWVKTEQWQNLSTDHDRRGYLRINLWRDGKMYRFTVHRLVLTAFVGPCPSGMVACHRNGNNVDNRLENLRWDTPESNDEDMRLHGRRPRGSRNAAAKLTEKDIPEIHRLRQQGLTYKAIGERFGVHLSTVAYAIKGTNWQHVPR